MSDFKIGDTVMVAYPNTCCGSHNAAGECFTINGLGFFPGCHYAECSCGNVDANPDNFVRGCKGYFVVEKGRLIKIADPSQEDEITTNRDIGVEA